MSELNDLIARARVILRVIWTSQANQKIPFDRAAHGNGGIVVARARSRQNGGRFPLLGINEPCVRLLKYHRCDRQFHMAFIN